MAVKMDQVTARVSDSVAAAAVASPFWLPVLQTWSDVAALLLPIAGLVWLIIQIVTFLWKRRNV